MLVEKTQYKPLQRRSLRSCKGEKNNSKNLNKIRADVNEMQIWSVFQSQDISFLFFYCCRYTSVRNTKAFFLRCLQKRQLVLFSVWGCVQINCTMIGCQNGKSCELSMWIWICLCHSTCGAFLETIAVTAKKQSEPESRLQSRDCSIVFYQARVVFSSTETTFFDFSFFFQYFKRSEGTVSCPAPLDTNCFRRGKLVWKLCCLLFKEKHA